MTESHTRDHVYPVLFATVGWLAANRSPVRTPGEGITQGCERQEEGSWGCPRVQLPQTLSSGPGLRVKFSTQGILRNTHTGPDDRLLCSYTVSSEG